MNFKLVDADLSKYASIMYERDSLARDTTVKEKKECFMQYITSGKVAEVYFTGMFTSNQGDLSVHYYDPESGRIRQYP